MKKTLTDFFPVSSEKELIELIQFVCKESPTANKAIEHFLRFKMPHNDNIVAAFLFGAVYRSEAGMRAAVMGENGYAILTKLLKL